MKFDEYQLLAAQTSIYPPGSLEYVVLGLASEAGEVAGKLKKIIRDNGGALDDASKSALAAEVGDVLWYAAAIASELQLRLGDIATANIKKLARRAAEHSLKGDGDER